jgi:16S rRNA (guanine966-N2)-methyltransferase
MTFRIVAGNFKNRELKSPPGDKTRPTTGLLRKALFDICRPQIEGARFLDLFAGTGAMGLEALSRGAKSACFVEAEGRAAEVIRRNIQTLGVEKSSQLLKGDALVMLNRLIKLKEQFDLIYVDPPYEMKIYHEVIALIDKSALLAAEGWLFVEEGNPPQIDPKKLQLSSLTYIEARRYGNSTLHLFLCKK